MKSNLIALAFLFLGLNAANANVTTCTNSNQTLSFTERSETSKPSSAEAKAEGTATLKYQFLSQSASKASDLDFHLTKSEIKSRQKSGANQLVTSVALATGTIASDGNKTPFSDWVVCTSLTK